MRIEELLEKGLELEVGRVNLYNRQTALGATEAIVQVHLQHPLKVIEDFNQPTPYLDLSFEVGRNQIENYLPGTKFHLSITPAK